jgi:hypothetical protein
MSGDDAFGALRPRNQARGPSPSLYNPQQFQDGTSGNPNLNEYLVTLRNKITKYIAHRYYVFAMNDWNAEQTARRYFNAVHEKNTESYETYDAQIVQVHDIEL